ncbi:MAG: NAD(+)/NADH kinase, partial [Parabacteroides sp.]
MKIGIFGREYKANKQKIVMRLFDKLHQLQAEVYIDSRFHDFLLRMGYEPQFNGLLEGDDFDLDVALSVGGDGTFLRTAARINKQNIPILGINIGRLGFLADIGSDEIEDTLDELFRHYYKVEERTLLRLHTD